MRDIFPLPAAGWNRRDFLARTGAGFGTLGLAGVLQVQVFSQGRPQPLDR